MIVNSNPTSKLAQRYLQRATSSHTDSMNKLASGSSINSAKDDAAGLQISNRLQAQRSGLGVAVQNANNAISLTQVAEGALDEYSSIVMRMRDLAIQSANDSYTDKDRSAMDQEVQDLKSELIRIANTTSFAGRKLLNGTTQDLSFQIGSCSGEAISISLPNFGENILREKKLMFTGYGFSHNIPDGWQTNKGDKITFQRWERDGKKYTIDFEKGLTLQGVADKINGSFDGQFKAYIHTNEYFMNGERYHNKRLFLMTTEDCPIDVVESETKIEMSDENGENVSIFPLFLKIGKPLAWENLNVKYGHSAQECITVSDQLLKTVDTERAKLGAVQNRLSHAINNLSQTSENVTASNSRIRDTDFARETSRLAKESILKEANTAMLAQASKAPQEALNLLK